jgi:indole-3-glycerol phosphate synthase
MNILDKIIAFKHQQLVESKLKSPVEKLEKSRFFERDTLLMTNYIKNRNKTGIIAEFKRKSPSKGMINAHSTVEEVTTGYFRSGASGISILTDQEFFGGSDDDLARARELNSIPILRKDFIIDEYQIIETKAIGADAVLLIAKVLTKENTKKLARLARSLNLQVLLEVHNARELGHLNNYINMVGVNNRDLDTFTIDIETSVQLVGDIPGEFVKISESGITSALAIKKLRNCGYQGFLIGENFMRTTDPATSFSEFVQQIIIEND